MDGCGLQARPDAASWQSDTVCHGSSARLRLPTYKPQAAVPPFRESE